jgi:hypothetical protein
MELINVTDEHELMVYKNKVLSKTYGPVRTEATNDW